MLPFLFADCSKTPQRNATIGMYNKGAVRERQTGRPPNLRLSLPSHAGYLLRVPLLWAGHSRSLKKTVPRQCEAIAVARTDYQIPPDSRKCSGVSIPQAVSLSPPFHDTACILFWAQKSTGCTALWRGAPGFVIRWVLSLPFLTAGRQGRRRQPPAQAPAPLRPECRWGSGRRDTAG